MAMLSGIYKGKIAVAEFAYYAVFSFLMLSFLAYVEPIEYLIFQFLRFCDKRALDKPNSVYLLRNAFESSYLDYSRVRLKSAFYLAILLIVVAYEVSAVRFLAVVVLIFIIIRFIRDLVDLPMRVYAVLGYMGAIHGAGKRYSKAEEYLKLCRTALESGNWVEAFSWLAIVGIPGNVRIPREIQRRYMYEI